MRATLGLPSPEMATGQAAHDFVQALGATEVYFTNATRVGGVETVPCRWLLRLEAEARALRGLSAEEEGPGLDRSREAQLTRWLALLRTPAAVTPVQRPAPRPSLDRRPTDCGASQVETWLSDPFAFYARQVLELSPLPLLGQALDVLERGTMIHRTLELFLEKTRLTWPTDPLVLFQSCAEEAMADALERPDVKGLWWPRMERLGRWFVTFEAARRSQVRLAGIEVDNKWVLTEGLTRQFTLNARMDRVDQALEGGGVWVADFKSGASPPKKPELMNGRKPQLPLSALMVRHGQWQPAGGAAADRATRSGDKTASASGNPDLEDLSRTVERISIIQVSGGHPPGAETTLEAEELSETLETTQDGLLTLLRTYEDEATPYLCLPDPARFTRLDRLPYGHLARVAEWLGQGGDE